MAMRYQHATQERDRAFADKLGVLMRGAEAEIERTAMIAPIRN